MDSQLNVIEPRRSSIVSRLGRRHQGGSVVCDKSDFLEVLKVRVQGGFYETPGWLATSR